MAKTLIILAGATAVGKTALALELAQHFDTEIISADSRQCYIELGIGAAKPAASELALVPHHFINSHSIHQHVDAQVFAEQARTAVGDIFSRRNMAVMAGGTGLYLHSFLYGLNPMPEVPPGIRARVRTHYEQFGLDWLQREVKFKDPAFYAAGEIQNPHRLMRALEIVLATGKSILTFRQPLALAHDFDIVAFHVVRPRSELYEKINARVDGMIGAGLEAEARTLYPHRHVNALQTVGYRELFEYFDGKTDLSNAIESIKTNTRHYAKRQMTWFRKWPVYKEVSPELPSILQTIQSR